MPCTVLIFHEFLSEQRQILTSITTLLSSLIKQRTEETCTVLIMNESFIRTNSKQTGNWDDFYSNNISRVFVRAETNFHRQVQYRDFTLISKPSREV